MDGLPHPIRNHNKKEGRGASVGMVPWRKLNSLYILHNYAIQPTKMNNEHNYEKLHMLMIKLEKEGMEKTFIVNKKYERYAMTNEIPLLRDNPDTDKIEQSGIIFTLRRYYNITCNRVMNIWNKQKEIEDRKKYINELEKIISDGSEEFEKEMRRKMTFKEMRMIYG